MLYFFHQLIRYTFRLRLIKEIPKSHHAVLSHIAYTVYTIAMLLDNDLTEYNRLHIKLINDVNTCPYPMPSFPGLVRKFFGSRTWGGLGLVTGLNAAGDGLMQGQKLPLPQLQLNTIHISQVCC